MEKLNISRAKRACEIKSMFLRAFLVKYTEYKNSWTQDTTYFIEELVHIELQQMLNLQSIYLFLMWQYLNNSLVGRDRHHPN